MSTQHSVCVVPVLISFRSVLLVWLLMHAVPSRRLFIGVQIAQDAEQHGVESAFEQLKSFLCSEDCEPADAAKHPKKKKNKKKKNKKKKKKKDDFR